MKILVALTTALCLVWGVAALVTAGIFALQPYFYPASDAELPTDIMFAQGLVAVVIAFVLVPIWQWIVAPKRSDESDKQEAEQDVS